MIESDGIIELGKPFDIELFINGKQIATGAVVPSAGLAIQARLCADNSVATDQAIHNDLVVSALTEGAEVEIDGELYSRYYASIAGLPLITHLLAHLHKYVVFVGLTPGGVFRHVKRYLVTQGLHSLQQPTV